MCPEDAATEDVTCRLAVVGRLTAHVIHDVNNTFTPLIGRLQMLRMKTATEPVAMGPELETIDRDALSISQRLQALCGLARQAAYPAAPGPCVISDLLREVDYLVGHHLARRGLSVHLDLPPSLPPILARAADVKLLAAALMLMFLDAAPSESELQISACEVDRGRVLLRCAVQQDLGEISIPPELRHLAFCVSTEGIEVQLPDRHNPSSRIWVPVATWGSVA